MVTQFVPQEYPLGRVGLGQQGQGSFMRPVAEGNYTIKDVNPGCGSCTRITLVTDTQIDFVFTAPRDFPEHIRNQGFTETKDVKFITITYEETDESGQHLQESIRFTVTMTL